MVSQSAERSESDAEKHANRLRLGCVYSDKETPVPIPNTEVKLVSGDGTALLSVGE